MDVLYSRRSKIYIGKNRDAVNALKGSLKVAGRDVELPRQFGYGDFLVKIFL